MDSELPKDYADFLDATVPRLRAAIADDYRLRLRAGQSDDDAAASAYLDAVEKLEHGIGAVAVKNQIAAARSAWTAKKREDRAA